MRAFDPIFGFIICLSLLLAACGAPQASDLWQDYQQRLVRLAGEAGKAAETESPVTPRPRWPGGRQLQAAVPEWRTNLLGWLDLIDCELSALVAARNGSLGRMQHASLRLRYEITFIDEASACLLNLDEDHDMRPWLGETVTGKRLALPSLYWNATLASPEWRDALAPQSVPADLPLPVDGQALAQTLLHWASQLQALQDPGATPDISQLESQLQALTRNRPGLATDALIIGSNSLQLSTAVLTAIDTDWLCPHDRASTRARYLHNVFANIYGGRIQPWISAVWRESAPLAEALQALRISLPGTAQAQPVRDWIDQWLALHATFKAELDAHVRAWQTVLGACRLMPGQEPPLASPEGNTGVTANDHPAPDS